EQREALRRELLVQLEEEQRSDAMEIGQKTTGATYEGFETSRQLESGSKAKEVYGRAGRWNEDGFS
ncbi:MAG: hypothetical protein FWD69_02415, partial [Polyangiaceae bacterium]|nr:hypothetical protein [Polyangiaceae bacterium]